VDEEGASADFVVLGYGPNPAVDGMYVSFTTTTPRTITYRVVDMNGAEVLTFTRAAFAGLNSALIDVRSIASGRYTLVLTADGLQRSIPLVVQR